MAEEEAADLFPNEDNAFSADEAPTSSSSSSSDSDAATTGPVPRKRKKVGKKSKESSYKVDALSTCFLEYAVSRT